MESPKMRQSFPTLRQYSPGCDVVFAFLFHCQISPRIFLYSRQEYWPPNSIIPWHMFCEHSGLFNSAAGKNWPNTKVQYFYHCVTLFWRSRQLLHWLCASVKHEATVWCLSFCLFDGQEKSLYGKSCHVASVGNALGKSQHEGALIDPLYIAALLPRGWYNC